MPSAITPNVAVYYQMIERLSPVFIRVLEESETKLSGNEKTIAQLLSTNVQRINHACHCLCEGRMSEGGDFGDIAQILLRPCLEASTNFLYVFSYLSNPLISNGIDDSKIAASRLVDYWKIKSLKTVNVIQDDTTFRPMFQKLENSSAKIDELKTALESYKKKYFPHLSHSDRLPPTAPWLVDFPQRIICASKGVAHEDERMLLSSLRINLENLNSWVHCDLKMYSDLVGHPAEIMRHKRVELGEGALVAICGLNLMVWRQFAKVVGFEEEFEYAYELEHERFRSILHHKMTFEIK